MKVYKEKSPTREIIKWYFIALFMGMFLGGIVDYVLQIAVPGYQYNLACLAICFLLLVMMKRRFKRGGIEFDGCLGAKNLGLGFKLMAIYLVYIAYEASKSLVMPPVDHIIGSVQAAFMEEIMFRLVPITIMVYAFRFNEKKDRLILFITAFVFSIFHAGNIIAGANVQATMVQLVSTFGMGIYFGAIFLRTGNGWPLVIGHFINNFVASMQMSTEKYGVKTTEFSTTDTVVACVVALVMIALGMYYTRKEKLPAINEVWKAKFQPMNVDKLTD